MSSATFPPQAGHVLVDLLSSVVAGGRSRGGGGVGMCTMWDTAKHLGFRDELESHLFNQKVSPSLLSCSVLFLTICFPESGG